MPALAFIRCGRLAATLLLALPLSVSSADWPSAGGDLSNTRSQPRETRISPATAGALALRWSFETAGDVTASPALDSDHLYFPDSAGYLYKLRRADGALVWKSPVSAYTGIPGDFARATPAIHGNLLILGNQSGKIAVPPNSPAPARVFAVDKRTGAPVWSTQVDDTFLSFVTQAAVVHDGTVYVGTASNEELVAAFVPKAYWTWQFRGAAVALDAATGAIRWKTYMVPAGYYGGAIWGSTPAVDPATNTVYMTTGNNYWVPTTAVDCVKAGQPAASCLAADNHFDSIVAMDAATGQIRWASRGLSYDAWSVACGLSVPGIFTLPANDNCPDVAGPDWDFAQGAMLFGEERNGFRHVGAGQKSGVFRTFDARTGAAVWSTQVAPGGVTGGLQWGSAVAGNRIVVAASNSGPSTNGGGFGAEDWLLKNGKTTKTGGWAALDRRTGEVLWTTPDPNGSRAEGAVAVAGNVVFGCNVDFARGTMFALDARNGAVLWQFDSGGACNAAPTVADGMVFWGSGNFLGGPTPKRVFAFGL